jgi:hypothetical protein
LIQSGLFTELRGILYTLRQRREAMETVSPDRLERFISKDYHGEVIGRDKLMSKIRNELSGVPEHAVVVGDLAIEVEGDLAKVNQQVFLVIPWDGKMIEKSAREKLALRREGERWRFVGGLG